jgi:hypothetical protein
MDYPLIIRRIPQGLPRPEHARALHDCERCSFTYYLDELKSDGEAGGLLVCDECYDPKQPEPQLTGDEDS